MPSADVKSSLFANTMMASELKLHRTPCPIGRRGSQMMRETALSALGQITFWYVTDSLYSVVSLREILIGVTELQRGGMCSRLKLGYR